MSSFSKWCTPLHHSSTSFDVCSCDWNNWLSLSSWNCLYAAPGVLGWHCCGRLLTVWFSRPLLILTQCHYFSLLVHVPVATLLLFHPNISPSILLLIPITGNVMSVLLACRVYGGSCMGRWWGCVCCLLIQLFHTLLKFLKHQNLLNTSFFCLPSFLSLVLLYSVLSWVPLHHNRLL